MSPIRMLEPEDYEPAVRCASCDEWLPEAESGFSEGAHFHPACRPDLVRCCWCGEWLPKLEARQLGKEFYHPRCFEEAGP
jgi:formylmethanofuran dehydrogenase subunit E